MNVPRPIWYGIWVSSSCQSTTFYKCLNSVKRLAYEADGFKRCIADYNKAKHTGAECAA